MYTKTNFDCDFNKDEMTSAASRQRKKSLKSLHCNDVASNQQQVKLERKKNLPRPSDYIKQITTNPENVLRKDCKTGIEASTAAAATAFTTNPKIVIFPRFEIGNYYNLTLQIRNTSKLPHQLRLQDSNDLHFNILFKGSVLNTRLAPGMTHVYEVEFHPDEIRHYFHEIQFKTDMGPFTVPIMAVGPRALLAFPDQINMGQTAVKVAKTKPILMQNIGDIFTAFSIFTDNSNFIVTPTKGTVRFDEAIQIQLTFKPTKIGITNGRIILRYESGDKVQSMIYGEAVQCDVQLVDKDIRLENTYFGLSRLAIIEIKNNSDYLLPYRFVRFKSLAEDNEERERWKDSIPRRDLSSDASLLKDEKLICNRVHADEVDSINDITFTYSDKNFEIFPIYGEAWPHNSTNVTITFLPKQVGDISSTTLYLDVAGQENRIPISIRGKCIGPSLELNLLELDIQQVYLCSTYKYEVVCRNVGPIAGTIRYKQNNTNFGSMITVEPAAEINIEEGHFKSMILSFYSSQTGTFVERVDFLIVESSEMLSFIIKGTVICPLVRGNEEGKIDLSPASIGFTMKKQLSFRNLSHAPIDFSIKIPSDGYENVITHDEFAKALSKPTFRLASSPREFNVCPCRGTISPLTSVTVQVAYTPNIVRAGETNLQIELCDCTGDPAAAAILVPISFDAKTARFTITPTEVTIRFCFVNFPYCRNVSVTNSSDVNGYFYILPQKTSSLSPILYSLSTYQGYLDAGQSKEIQLTVIVKEIGEQRINLSILSLGFFEPVLACEVICIGQGPVVSVEPSHLNWSEVTLLQPVGLTLNIFNDSPIPAEFSAYLSKLQSVWNVEPLTGELGANESSTLTISILLKDAGKYSDRLCIKVYSGKTIIVNLSAIGVGTCITFEPDIFPILDMGFLFSQQNVKIPLIVKNKGNRQHQIILTNTEKMKQSKKEPTIWEESENAGKYKMDPSAIELLPGAEKTVHCKTRWNTNEVVTEQWFVYASVEGGKRELLGSSTFVATFIEPTITFDKKELTFRIDKGLDYEMFQQEDEICIINQSGRSLTAHFHVDAPFFIIHQCNCLTNSHTIVLHNDEPVYLKCHFSFDIEGASTPKKFNGDLRIAYEEHKQTDKISCIAQINFPHLVVIPREVNLYCVVGHKNEENVKILNDSPLPVYYKISWIRESFRYKLLLPRSESRKGSDEGAESAEACLERDAFSPPPPPPPPITFSKSDECCKELAISDNYCAADDSSSDVFREMCSIQICECGLQSIDQQQASTVDLSSQSYKYYGRGESQTSSSTVILEDLSFIDKLLQLEPMEGLVLPSTEQNLTITFNGFENITLYIEAICEVQQGVEKILKIHATADSVRCEIQDYVLDFGLQLFSEPSVAALKIFNQCMIPLNYNVDSSSNLIKIIDAPKEFNPNSESTILVERQPSAPGILDEKLLIEVVHLEPFIINVKSLLTIPQIYLDLIRNEAFAMYPIEYGYEAVQLVMAESSIQEENYVDCCRSVSNAINDADLTEYDSLQLTEENWEVITNKEKCPGRIDIDMAFERLIVKRCIMSNVTQTRSISSLHEESHELLIGHLPDDLSTLLAPCYTIDMKYLLVNQVAQTVVVLKNYGYERAKIKLLRRDDKKKRKSKTLFFVRLEKKVEICQCESTHLSITFYPKKNMFPDRRTDLSHKFFLEIKHGLTIPVIVKAAAVYPFITVNTHLLNFDKVYTGQCRELTLTLKNQGFVDCQWDISIENLLKNQHKLGENPFYVNYAKDSSAPGHEATIKVYFRPDKNGNYKRNLNIRVQNGQENEFIRLIGYGVERKLDIDKKNISFEPIIPRVHCAVKNFTVKNINSCPVEVYWQHLEDFSEINRIIRVLKHYYKTEEILIPERTIGETDKLIEFYNKLVLQMFRNVHFRSFLDDMFLINTTAENSSFPRAAAILDSAKDQLYSVTDDNLMTLLDEVGPQIDEKELEAFLHAYVDKLQERPNSVNVMYPLDEIYEKDISGSEETRENVKNLIIIFHGAPYTEYQETACRSAKVLKLPVLNLNNIFIEALAYSSSERVKVLRECIEKRYKELIELLEKMFSQQGKKVSEKTDLTQAFYLLLRKVPPAEQVETMDNYLLYEHKFEMICLITNLLESGSSGTAKLKAKTSVKGQDFGSRKASILPAVEQDVFRDILRDSLSRPKYKYGYVLQTLNNDFMRNESLALNTLLEATGNVDVYLFITFHNGFGQFQMRRRYLNRMKEEEAENRERENLKKYQDATKSEGVSEDEIKFRCDELKAKRNQRRRSTTRAQQQEAPSVESEEQSKIAKDVKSYINKKRAEKCKNSVVSKNSDPSEILNVKEIEKEMNEYETSVNVLLEEITNWERGVGYRGSVMPLKNAKGKMRSSIGFVQPKVITDTEKFFVFRVRAQDPWGEKSIHDALVSLLPAGFNLLNLSGFEETSRPLTEMRTYSILREYEILDKNSCSNDIFNISLQNLNNLLNQECSILPLLIDECGTVNGGDAARESNSSSLNEIFPSRWTLQPDESKTFKVEFRPTQEGLFQANLSLALIDDPTNIYQINVKAIAQEAKIDMSPESLFDKLKVSEIDQSDESAYSIDSPFYDFGSILVLRNKTHKKSTQLKFRNISLVTATVSLSLLNKTCSVFTVYPENLEILPNEVGCVNLTASTQNLGINFDDLIVSIKDRNEQPENISLRCTGVEFKFSVEPKILDFGRLLIRNRGEKQIITIQNLSAVTVYWRLLVRAEDSRQMLFYPSSGKIKYNEITQVEVEYLANDIALPAETRTVALEVFLEKDTAPEPIAVYIITIAAESYEIIDNLDSAENLIDFKTIPVESFARETLAIKNLGSYEFKYEIMFQRFENSRADKNLLPTLVRDLQVYPTTGSILPKKQAMINFTYKPSCEATLKSAPLFKYSIIDLNFGPVKEGLLNVCLAAYHTRFKIEPQAILNFGTLAPKSSKTLQINVENIGKIPLRYSLINIQTITRQLDNSSLKRQSTLSKKDGRNQQESATTKKRSISIQNPVIKWGPFTLDKNQGELEPGEKDSLIVGCSSETIGQFDEKLVILVPGSQHLVPGVDQAGQEISLIAEVVVATIDYYNFVEIFPDSHVVHEVEDLASLHLEAEEHTIFLKALNTLYFRKVCIGCAHTASITLRNASAVPAKIIAEIENDSVAAFRTNVEHLEIAPASKATLSLLFSPNFLGTFSGLLKIKLDEPQSVDSRTFSLQGEGHVPQIRILEPTAQLDGSLFIKFGLTYVAEPREKILKIQNIGEIIANVTIEINDDDNAVYKILLDREKMSLPCNCPAINKESHIADFRIRPNEIVDVKLQFVPVKVGKLSSRLKVEIEGNPYETITDALLAGEGFVKPIVLYNLDIVDPSYLEINDSRSRGSIGKSQKYRQSKNASRSSSKVLNDASSVSYALDYGKCYLNRMSKINFTIVNKTQDRYFRFEWTSNPNVVCTPSAGHLAPNNFKELTATFLTTEPISLLQVPWQCKVQQIILNEPPIGDEPLWDNRQSKVSWIDKIPSSELAKEETVYEDVVVKKEIIKSKEPGSVTIGDSEETIELLISAIADYSDYRCNLKSIKFDDTLMFEHKEFNFLFENTGVVQLDYIWSLTMDEHYPLRLDQSQCNSANMSFECSTADDRSTKNSTASRKRNSTQSSRAETQSASKRQFHVTSAEDSNKSKEQTASDLFSNSAGLTDRSTDSWMEGENWPFEMSPIKGSLLPGKSVKCTLKFSPVDVFLYKAYLQCKIENLNPNKEPLRIVVYAKSLLPYCHFEMEKSDYLDGRRDVKLPLPQGLLTAAAETQSKLRLTEFTLMGVGECHARFIYLINPTSEDYKFSFTRIDLIIDKQTTAAATLQCLTESGVAKRGSKTAIKFIFVPESIGLIETHWLFRIKKYNLESLFLIVINTVEPSLTCKHLVLKMGPSHPGQVQRSQFEITNNECCQLKFALKPDSLYSADGRFQAITAYPLVGTLCPNSTKNFYIEYEPSMIGVHTFIIECQVEKVKKPIKVFVTAQVFDLRAKLYFINPSGGRELNVDCENIIDIDQLFLNEPLELKFRLTNNGKLPFDYSWNLNLMTNPTALSLSTADPNGRVDENCQCNCHLQLLATDKLNSLKYPLTMKILYGPTFRLKLNVSSTTPIEFSFNSYNFGPCYIQMQEGILYFVDLLLTNNNEIPCALLSHDDGCPEIKVDFQYLAGQAIPAKTSVRVPIHFQPLEESEYEKILYFSMGSIKKKIFINGEGIPYKVSLKNPCDAFIDFGTLLVGGKSICRKIRILNEGRLSVRFAVIVLEVTTEDSSESCLEPSEICIKDRQTENFDIAKFIAISPCGLQDLNPCKELELTIKLKAAQPVKWLKAKFGMQMDHYSCLPLTTIKAACSWANFYLNRTFISFGTLYEGCGTLEEKFILINDGDVGSRFHWRNTDLSYFRIEPIEGYSSAKSAISFTCTFAPICGSDTCIENKASLILEDYANLRLTMAGNCRKMPEPMRSIDFTAEIGQSEGKEIEIHNDSLVSWYLKPIILGDYFTAPTEFSINPKSTSHFIVTYTPLRETTFDHFDKGKLVVTLPDAGKAPISFELQGRCTRLSVAENTYRQIPAKKKYTETFGVYNSSCRYSIFDCKTELFAAADENKKPSNANVTQITVPAKQQVQHRVTFYFENEGTYFCKVRFDNHRGNVQNYNIEFTVTKPLIQDVVQLNTYVRSCIFHTIKIENPLEGETVIFEATSSNEDVTIHGFPLSLPPLAFKNIQLKYFPLHPCCDGTAELEISSETLGSLFYQLHLNAMPAPPEKALYVHSSLGTETSFALKLKNYSKLPSEFIVQLDDPSLTCSTSPVLAAANNSAKIEVKFEPYSLEEVKSTIKATSDVAGEFVFPVIAQGTRPSQPFGPFLVTVKAPATITFKNPFFQPRVFNFTMQDSTDFLLLTNSRVTIASKKSFDIIVQLQSKEKIKYEKSVKVGKLIVSCDGSSSADQIKWIYYLKGLVYPADS